MTLSATTFNAEITFITDDLPFSGKLNGQSPSFNYGGELTACQVNCDSGVDRDSIERKLYIEIQLFYTTKAHESLAIGERFKLNVGGNTFADGTVTSEPSNAA